MSLRSMPLSFAQERLWFVEQLGLVGSAYTIPVVLRIEGRLDVRALERSVEEVVRRHEVLRARFEESEGGAVQVNEEFNGFELRVVDLSKVAAQGREREVERLVQEETQRRFSLLSGELFRVAVLRLSEKEHVMLMTMHHIVADGWSIEILMRELSVLYGAYVRGEPSPLKDLSIQYADYALWQRQWLQGEVLEKQLSYWRERLTGAPPVIDLPTDRPRPAVASFRGEVLGFSIGKGLVSRLMALSRSEGATLFMVFLAAFEVLLSRWSGQTDIVVGSPIAGRAHRQTQDLIGFFVNVVALRLKWSEGESFRELLRQAKDAALDADAYQDIPFERLVAELDSERDLSRHPIFQVTLTMQPEMAEMPEFTGIQVTAIRARSVSAKCDLSLFVQESGEGLSCAFEYATDLFDRGTVERLAGHFEVLLEGIVSDADRPVSQLPMLTAAERDCALVEWNATQGEYPRGRCVHELFSEQASRTPQAVALECEGQELSYGELERRSNQLAHHLRGLGVGPEVIVGLCVERSFEMVVGLLGILKAGGAYLPLDPSYPVERLAFMLEDARVKVLVSREKELGCLPELKGRLVSIDQQWRQIERQEDTVPVSGVSTSNLAYVIYTSGSTGKPKGVMVAHCSLTNLAQAQVAGFHVKSSSAVLQFASLGFDASVSEIVMALGSGGTLVLSNRPALQVGKTLSEAEVTVVTLPPSALELLGSEELPKLQTLVVAGEACRAKDVQRWSTRCQFINAYGPTETTVCASFAALSGDDEQVHIGRPILNMQMYVLDEGLEPVPVGVTGEIYIGGVGVARGYLNRPGLTAERFIADPFGVAGARLYRSGDLGRYLADGNIEFLGRADHQVKIRGHRIELGEIEEALLSHGAVRQAVVIAREDEPGDRRLVAYVVARVELRAETLRGHLKRTLPEHMVPGEFVQLGELPLTPSGKVDRGALPAPEPGQQTGVEYVAPRTATEQLLARVWADVLKLERVGVRDNFFDLGGHSLLMPVVVKQINEAGDHRANLIDLFSYPDIQELAIFLESGPRHLDSADPDGRASARQSIRERRRARSANAKA